jgi:hypothetical protein
MYFYGPMRLGYLPQLIQQKLQMVDIMTNGQSLHRLLGQAAIILI